MNDSPLKDLRIIAFLDILGFKELYKTEKKDELLKVLELIRTLNSDSEIEMTTPVPSKHDANVKEFSYGINFDIISFSDHIIISAPLTLYDKFNKNAPNDWLNGRHLNNTELHKKDAIYFLLQHINPLISKICLFLLKDHSIVLRGAISVGDVHYDKKNNIITGTPFFEVVEYESKLAIYPRVIFSKEILKYYITDHVGNVHYDLCTVSKIRRDFDGIYYINFLESLAWGESSEKEVAQVHNIIKEKINTYSGINTVSIAAKWHWLASYFDKNIKSRKEYYPRLSEYPFNFEHGFSEDDFSETVIAKNEEVSVT